MNIKNWIKTRSSCSHALLGSHLSKFYIAQYSRMLFHRDQYLFQSTLMASLVSMDGLEPPTHLRPCGLQLINHL